MKWWLFYVYPEGKVADTLTKFNPIWKNIIRDQAVSGTVLVLFT